MKPILARLTTPSTQDPAASAGLLVLRVSAGLHLALLHGWGKFSMLLSGGGAQFPDPLGVGGTASLFLASSAEFLAAIAVAAGLFTRLASVPVGITMLVAVFAIHAGQPWADRELAVIYGTIFLGLGLTGGGAWSLDSLVARWASDEGAGQQDVVTPRIVAAK